MNLGHGSTLPTVHPEQSHLMMTHLQGRRLVLARLTWFILVAFSLLLFIVNMSLYAKLLETVCAPAALCPAWQPTLETASALHHLGFSLDDYAAFNIALTIISALLWIGIGLFVFWRKSNEWVIMVFAFWAVIQGINGPNGYLDSLRFSHSLWQFPVTGLNALNLGVLWLVFALFPNGRFAPRWLRWLLLTYIVVYLIVSVFFIPNLLHSRPLGGPFFFLTTGSVFGGQIYRYLHVSSHTERQQTKWIVFSLAIVLLVQIGIILPSLFVPMLRQSDFPYIIIIQTVDILILLIVPPSIAIALLRYRLWDIDIIINRTLVYGALTASIVGIYVFVVVSLGALLQTSNNPLVSLLATGLVAVLFQPIRERLQLVVNRLMFGKRDTPYQVISHLGQRLEATLMPEAILPTIVETVAQALKLPYAAITLKQRSDFVIAASYGLPQETLTRLPLIYQTEQIGELLLAPRGPGETFTAADHTLLNDLARQAGIATYAVRLTTDLQHLTGELQHSRTQLVTRQEEERRRLRRDLHDGLGSALTSVTFQLDAASNLLDRDPQAVKSLLKELKAQTQSSIADIRRLVYNLRPPILDEWGLVPALREQMAQYQLHNVQVTVDAPESLPVLPAAIEVAAYRITLEALANVVRHAQASTCTIRLSIGEDALMVEVHDDGCGLPRSFHAGVGINAMRERAAELGGSCIVETVATGGTRVSAGLPLMKE